jgi:hypothetical protein
MVSGVRLPEFVVPEVAVAERDWQSHPRLV